MKKYIVLTIIVTIFIIFFSVRGIVVHSSNNKILWTEEEQKFLEEHPVIRLGVDPRFVPFEFIDEKGEYKGIAADYLEIISERTGLEFLIPNNLTWQESYEKALKHEFDALPAIGKTWEREKSFLFSEPYYYFKRVIAIRDTNNDIQGINDLNGTTVAVQENSSHHSYLLQYENINLSLYDSVEAALMAVATGKETAFIGNFATTNYLVKFSGITDLEFISFETETSQALYFATRKDWPELVSIFNKAMNSITEKEKVAINNKWIDLNIHFDYGYIIRIVLLVISFFAIILAVSSYWIARLRKEIQQRMLIQKELEKAKNKIEHTNINLLKANKELEKMSMVDGLTGISNRRYFDNILDKLWEINARESFPIALIMIDIDHFKSYNDIYGHLVVGINV